MLWVRERFPKTPKFIGSHASPASAWPCLPCARRPCPWCASTARLRGHAGCIPARAAGSRGRAGRLPHRAAGSHGRAERLPARAAGSRRLSMGAPPTMVGVAALLRPRRGRLHGRAARLHGCAGGRAAPWVRRRLEYAEEKVAMGKFGVLVS